MDRRALQVFRQVALAEPLWPEPFCGGMKVARKLDDLPGLEWSTAGILSQAWPPAQAHIWDEAYLAYQAKLKDLRDHKRNDEADHFQAAVRQAIARDCVVKVRWTGDAYIDIMVKEPAGTICSLRNQRTTSGGMLAGDMSAGNQAGTDGHMAVYCCPKAFSGNYQLLIRRVVGKLNTGKVSVEVSTHFNTSQAKTFEQKIPVKDSEALVKFDVADGRRKESIQERQVVDAAVAAVAQSCWADLTRRHPEILAQQLAAVNDPAAAASLAAVQQAASSASAGESQPINPLMFPAAWPNGLNGAVGYMPLIITLSEGAKMKTTGVVSADRRYVRITNLPPPPDGSNFSQIDAVHTFNISSGQTQNTPGFGTGGQGFSGVGGGAGAGNVGGVGGGGGGIGAG
jgi:hypothetical protein